MSKLLLPIRVTPPPWIVAAVNRHMLANTVSITNNGFVASPLYFKSWFTSTNAGELINLVIFTNHGIAFPRQCENLKQYVL